MIRIGVSRRMILLIPAHPGCPRQSPESRKMVVVIAVISQRWCFQAISSISTRKLTIPTVKTHTTILQLSGFCPGQPGWAGTRRNIHPLTPVMVINHPLSTVLPPSTAIHDIFRVQFTCLTVFLHNLSPSFLWSTSWSGILHFILHTFLHLITVYFLQHMPIRSHTEN